METLRPIESLIPQRAPIVLVDSLDRIDGCKSYTSFTVDKGHLLTDDEGYLMQEGILEHIAQSAAARMGWIALQKGEDVPIGFIGSISKAHFTSRARVGEKIETTIEVTQEIGQFTLVLAKCKVDERVIATGEMKIFLNT